MKKKLKTKNLKKILILILLISVITTVFYITNLKESKIKTQIKSSQNKYEKILDKKNNIENLKLDNSAKELKKILNDAKELAKLEEELPSLQGEEYDRQVIKIKTLGNFSEDNIEFLRWSITKGSKIEVSKIVGFDDVSVPVIWTVSGDNGIERIITASYNLKDKAFQNYNIINALNSNDPNKGVTENE